MSEYIRIAGIVDDSITDGPGLRLTIFMQGCPRRCEGCHNPQALDFDGGEEKTVDELFARVLKNPLISGVTFSGGEPFSQAKALLPLAKKIKESGYELAAYTGYTFEELLSLGDDVSALLQEIDTVIDGPFVLSLRDLGQRFKGSTNQRVLDVKASLKNGSPVEDTSGRWL